MISSSHKSFSVICNYWVPLSPNSYLSVDVVNYLPYIYTYILTEISNLTCVKQNCPCCLPKLSSPIGQKDEELFLILLFFHTTHPIYSEQISLGLSYKCTEDHMEHFSPFRHLPSLSRHLLRPRPCQSILKDYPDSTPSPAFLHGAAGIIISKFKLDNLIHLLRPFQ